MEKEMQILERLAASHREAAISVNGNKRYIEVADAIERLLLEYKCLYMRPTTEEYTEKLTKITELEMQLSKIESVVLNIEIAPKTKLDEIREVLNG
jgi:hypothetical protein